METIKLKPRYYTVKQIQEIENCGRDKAYEIARELPHETRGRALFVFAEDYDHYYNKKREMAINNQNGIRENVYQIQRFKERRN